MVRCAPSELPAFARPLPLLVRKTQTPGQTSASDSEGKLLDPAAEGLSRPPPRKPVRHPPPPPPTPKGLSARVLGGHCHKGQFVTFHRA